MTDAKSACLLREEKEKIRLNVWNGRNKQMRNHNPTRPDFPIWNADCSNFSSGSSGT